MYKRQLTNGKFLLHEHPNTAISWNEKPIKDLLMHQAVTSVVAGQCQYGLSTKEKNGQPMPAMKPTRFMTNSTQMAEMLQKRCERQHEHQALVGGRIAAAAFYPLGLKRAIIKGIRKTKNARRAKEGEKKLINSTEVEGDKEVEVDISSFKVSPIKKSAGGHAEVIWEDSNFKAE